MRRFGNRKRTYADCLRAADALILNTRTPERITMETLLRSYGLKPADAEAKMKQLRARVGNG